MFTSFGNETNKNYICSSLVNVLNRTVFVGLFMFMNIHLITYMELPERFLIFLRAVLAVESQAEVWNQLTSDELEGKVAFCF